MAAQSYEFTGKTTDEAIADGLKTLKLRQDQVTVEVLHKGSRGIFGIGSEPALVRLTLRSTGGEDQEVKPSAPAVAAAAVEQTSEKTAVSPVTPANSIASSIDVDTTVINDPVVVSTVPASSVAATPVIPVAEQVQPLTTATVTPAVSTTDSVPVADATSLPDVPTAEPASQEVLTQLAVELLTKMIQLMGFQGNVTASWQAGDEKTGEYEETYLLLDVRGADLGALIGRRGETLDNMQYLLRLMINQRLRQWKNIVVDVEQYKARRLTQLTQLALRMADQVTTSGRAVSLEPMPPNERRVVHLALRDHSTVYTESSGDGERRKVNIVAK